MANVYDSKSYKDFVREELDSARFGRGARTRLAEALGVQMSFISLVLSAEHHFTAEHGLKLARFFGLDEDETLWLILLINHDRAGSMDLRKHYEAQMKAIKKSRSDIQARLKAKDTLSDGDVAEYYSSWHPTAVHMCIRNPETRDPEMIARKLKISRKKAISSLKILEKVGLAKPVKGKWIPQDSRFHFGKNSLALRSHHLNWRNMGIHALDSEQEDDLHYTAVLSVDLSAMKKIRTALLECIKSLEPEITKAKDEEVIALSFDLFRVP